jgi:hypothetical protein
MSKFIVALHLPNFTETPANTFATRFVGMYVKNGWHKIMLDGAELDAVLDRPLTGFTTDIPAAAVVATDTVLQAIQKLAKTVQSITLTGDVSGVATFEDGVFKITTKIEGSFVDKHKKYEFETPTLEWVISHNMEKHPAVTITDFDKEEVEADVEHDSEMQLRIIFKKPFAGIAFLN